MQLIMLAKNKLLFKDQFFFIYLYVGKSKG